MSADPTEEILHLLGAALASTSRVLADAPPHPPRLAEIRQRVAELEDVLGYHWADAALDAQLDLFDAIDADEPCDDDEIPFF